VYFNKKQATINNSVGCQNDKTFIKPKFILAGFANKLQHGIKNKMKW